MFNAGPAVPTVVPPPAPPPPPGSYGSPGGYGNFPPPQSDHPVQVSIVYPPRSNRLLAGLSIPYFLARIIMLIPALICLYVIGIIAAFAAWFACFAVLFTGRYPAGFHRFVTGSLRWATRAQAFLYGLTDTYPPFSLKP